jgi:Phytanoyl-CoA dioxygenase (PhyH)
VNSNSEVNILDELETSGCVWVREMMSLDECFDVGEQLDRALMNASSTLRNGEQVYGARNLIDIFPEAGRLLEIEAIHRLCHEILGPDWGVVRGLFFDKPPGSSWSLPWHQDLTIAVENNKLVSRDFKHPTCKAGVDHLEAPEWLLRQMLTLRFHLDDMSADNGPLCVRLGSHRAGKLIEGGTPENDELRELHCRAGDCLLMRPLLSHSSRLSRSDCQTRRRIVHLELSAIASLPDGLRWHRFLPAATMKS